MPTPDERRAANARAVAAAREAHLERRRSLFSPVVRVDRPKLDPVPAAPYQRGMAVAPGGKNSPTVGGQGPRPRPGRE